MKQMNTSSTKCSILLIVSIILFFSCATVSKNEKNRIPLWADLENISSVFPEKEYIARFGYGETSESAKLNADAELSVYFNNEILTHTSATEVLENKNTNTDIIRKLNRKIEISSNAELVALRHTDSWFDKSRNRYVVCAYINRNEAWQILQPKIESETTAFSKLYEESKKQSDTIKKIIFVTSALKQVDLFYEYYYLAMSLIPEKATQYSGIEKRIQQAIFDNKTLKTETALKIIFSGDDTWRVQSKLAQILSEDGFPIGNTSFKYKVNAITKIEIAENNGIFISYPQISVVIETKEGIVIASWAKQFKKVSAYNWNACERMCINKIEKELEDNFISEILSN